MREYKFRAQDSVGNWIYFTIRNVYPIKMEYYANEGQYTGLKDKNENEIYEGDILVSELTNLEYIVKWDDIDACFIGSRKGSHLSPHDWNKSSIVGNVYDTPKLR